MGLRLKLAFALASVTTLAVVAVGAIGYFSTAQVLRNELDTNLLGSAARLADPDGHAVNAICSGASDGDTAERDRDDLVAGVPGASIECIDPSGRIVGWISTTSTPPPVPPELARSTAAGVSGVTSIVLDDQTYRFVTVTAASGAKIRIGRSLQTTEQSLDSILVRTMWVGGGVIVLAALVGLLIAQWLSGPLELLTVAAEEVARTGETRRSIAVDRQDETGRLSIAFSSMLDELQESRVQQRQLVQDAGHELRTPLTSMRANVGTLLRHPGLDPEVRREALDAVDAELAELSALVDELIELAIDTPHAEELEAVRLDALVTTIVDRARRRFDRDIELTTTTSTVMAPPRLLTRAIWNLLDNATKFSPAGTPIHVDVVADSIVVRDHGPGIDAVDLPFVFDRFHRAADVRGLPGSGLGLAIVRRAADAAGAIAVAGNAPGGGARLEIHWPADAPRPDPEYPE